MHLAINARAIAMARGERAGKLDTISLSADTDLPGFDSITPTRPMVGANFQLVAKICKGRCSHGRATKARFPGRHMTARLAVLLVNIFPTSSRRTARSNGTAKSIKTNVARSSRPQLERARSASCLVLIFYVGTGIGRH